MLLLQPGASLILAAIILGESTTWLQLTGAALTCGGALIASMAASRAPAGSRAPASLPPGGGPGPERAAQP